jgi:hypothetical protein
MEKKREGDREAAGEVFLSSDPLYHCFFGIGDGKGELLKLLLYFVSGSTLVSPFYLPKPLGARIKHYSYDVLEYTLSGPNYRSFEFFLFKFDHSCYSKIVQNVNFLFVVA